MGLNAFLEKRRAEKKAQEAKLFSAQYEYKRKRALKAKPVFNPSEVKDARSVYWKGCHHKCQFAGITYSNDEEYLTFVCTNCHQIYQRDREYFWRGQQWM